ncbi:nuclear transport factor 2 family protein [Gillisia sp. M10.2A]|uniref:Nuclear transport factor 2 family protein n=1 Tax=Gillisia lutea TaxID=2909668 RepID=A0ABS9EKC7_9FLAO|nr:nuclear transport factor 2 family protein [Gillisia lutea]MCF4102609.1 nuclear transport factor 2 family protein [Gillisia lutea]
MKILLCILMLFIGMTGFSQEKLGDSEVQVTIQEFFEAFHKQDSIGLKKVAHPTISMQSIMTDSTGTSTIKNESYAEFLKAIVSIPTSTKFEERLHGFDIRVNGALASAITPYSFYVNGKLSHCGVNSFELFKSAEGWKIIYIVDTRVKENCDNP